MVLILYESAQNNCILCTCCLIVVEMVCAGYQYVAHDAHGDVYGESLLSLTTANLSFSSPLGVFWNTNYKLQYLNFYYASA